jgi:RNA polymerase sigma factor (sigma-70 family)
MVFRSLRVVNIEQMVQQVQHARTQGFPARELREELWFNCQEVVGSLATRFTRHNPQWREDLASEAYLKFEQALCSYDPGRGVPFRGFLSGCIQRAFIDRLRRRAESAVEYADDLPAPLPPIDNHLCLQELTQHVNDVLEDLIPRDRQREQKILAFRLRHLEGWSVEAIQKRMGVDCPNTVSQWIHRVRKAFEVEFPRRYPEYFAEDVAGPALQV